MTRSIRESVKQAMGLDQPLQEANAYGQSSAVEYIQGYTRGGGGPAEHMMDMVKSLQKGLAAAKRGMNPADEKGAKELLRREVIVRMEILVDYFKDTVEPEVRAMRKLTR